jgi:hypothetical protein
VIYHAQMCEESSLGSSDKNDIFNGIGGGLLGYYIIRWKVSLSVALLTHLVADLIVYNYLSEIIVQSIISRSSLQQDLCVECC